MWTREVWTWWGEGPGVGGCTNVKEPEHRDLRWPDLGATGDGQGGMHLAGKVAHTNNLQGKQNVLCVMGCTLVLSVPVPTHRVKCAAITRRWSESGTCGGPGPVPCVHGLTATLPRCHVLLCLGRATH